MDLLLVDTGDLHDGESFVRSTCLSSCVYEGTGLTDGYPAGGVDAHDVCRCAPYHLGKCPSDGLNHRLMSSSKNCLMTFLPLESMSFAQNIPNFNAQRTFQPRAIHLQQYS